MSSENKARSSAHRKRYWSVMLVGDHGRVIPFRHFKGMAIGICLAFLLLLGAVAAMAVIYTLQSKKLADFQTRISEIEQQNRKLRDEKEQYLTQLIVKEKQQPDKGEESHPATAAVPVQPKAAAIASGKKRPETPLATPEKSSPKQAVAGKPVPEKLPVEKKQPAAVQWKADIRRFSVNYDAGGETLKAQFRIYNRSKPKKPLSGKSVVVFKNLQESSDKWLTVPKVDLKDGIPSADKGQPFQIRNYLTMRFRSYRQKPPIFYNAITAYVFSAEGKLLATRDLNVKIDAPAPKKAAPKPAPDLEKKPLQPAENKGPSTDAATVKPAQGEPTAPAIPTQTPPPARPSAPISEGGQRNIRTVAPEPDKSQEASPAVTETATPPAEPAPDNAGNRNNAISPPVNRPSTPVSETPSTPPKTPETSPKP